MKAYVLRSFGSADNLELQDVADPVPAPDQVLVRVCATSVNPNPEMTQEFKVLQSNFGAEHANTFFGKIQMAQISARTNRPTGRSHWSG